jgi:hypothetical protein
MYVLYKLDKKKYYIDKINIIIGTKLFKFKSTVVSNSHIHTVSNDGWIKIILKKPTLMLKIKHDYSL